MLPCIIAEVCKWPSKYFIPCSLDPCFTKHPATNGKIALYCVTLNYTTYSALYCTVLYCSALHCTTVHCPVLRCTALCYTALHYITLESNRRTVQHCKKEGLPLSQYPEFLASSEVFSLQSLVCYM